MKLLLKSLLLVGVFFSCNKNTSPPSIKGPVEVNQNGDTSYYTIPPFSFANQHNQTVTNQTVDGHIYLADFFFTSCHSICPLMNKNLSMVYEKFKENKSVRFLSHTLDPEVDTPEVLLNYAKGLGVDNDQWDFVTGPEDEIYKLAGKEGYFITAVKDSSAMDGINHSGYVILVDKKGHIRDHYDLTDAKNIEPLIRDVNLLLHEED